MEKSSRLVCTWNSDEWSELDNALGSCRYMWQMKTGWMQRLRENVRGAMKAENRTL